MKKLFIALVAIATIATMASCTDPIYNDDPMDTSYSTGFPLDEFHKFGQDGDTAAQRQLVDQYRKQLTANVVNHYPDIQDEKNIKFVLGSGYAKDVLTGSGKTHSGKFENELIIIINDPAVKDTLFLACGNGMLSPLKFKEQSDFGVAEQWRFTILPGEGLAHHLPELQAWAKVAGELHIPIKDKTGKVVSQETYLNYLGKYESCLRPYDVIDLIAGKVYDENSNEVNFQQRMEDTKKANAKIAKAKTSKKKRR